MLEHPDRYDITVWGLHRPRSCHYHDAISVNERTRIGSLDTTLPRMIDRDLRRVDVTSIWISTDHLSQYRLNVFFKMEKNTLNPNNMCSTHQV